ncbi:Cobalt/magnesium transport protein CorA [Nymphon striatum]|nr:Cobalt/magnesium transport protein CorA [Nymphon striatum]
MSPGSLIHISDIEEQKPEIAVTHYSKESTQTFSIESSDELLNFVDKNKGSTKNSITWVQIEGLKNIEFLSSIGSTFKIHPLVLEDILNTHQRPKLEDNDDYQYIVAKSLFLESNSKTVIHEQISILLLENFVFTFKEKRDDLFLPIHKRINSNKSRIRNLGADYLVYVILDNIVDQNFVLIESLDEIIDSMEEEILSSPETKTLVRLQEIKKELIYIRRSVSPHRELLSAIIRSESGLIHNDTIIYFKDVYDHVLRITESIELQRDMVYSLMDMYQSSISNKMNETMKIKTQFDSLQLESRLKKIDVKELDSAQKDYSSLDQKLDECIATKGALSKELQENLKLLGEVQSSEELDIRKKRNDFEKQAQDVDNDLKRCNLLKIQLKQMAEDLSSQRLNLLKQQLMSNEINLWDSVKALAITPPKSAYKESYLSSMLQKLSKLNIWAFLFLIVAGIALGVLWKRYTDFAPINSGKYSSPTLIRINTRNQTYIACVNFIDTDLTVCKFTSII